MSLLKAILMTSPASNVFARPATVVTRASIERGSAFGPTGVGGVSTVMKLPYAQSVVFVTGFVTPTR